MKFKAAIFLVCYSTLLFSCHTKKEVVMPFHNLGYTSDRLLPVSFSSVNFEFRIWINNSTSIDRVISVSKDKDFGEAAYFTEIGQLFAKHKYKSKKFFNQTKITPKSGIDGFIAKIDSLKLSDFQSQDESTFQIGEHMPFSIYIVELKENGKYCSFKFNTHFPSKEYDDSKYTAIQKLIFSEFSYAFHMN